MKEQSFEISIHATASKIWEILWNEATYMQWTSAFCHGSHVKSDWKQGSRVQFLSPGGNGMYSEIELVEPNKKMVFKHIGEIKDFKELPNDKQTSSWTDAKESYTLTATNGQMKLVATVEFTEEYAKYFTEVFPKALAIVKELAEKNYITVTTAVASNIEKVWDYWTNPKHIIEWNNASEDWHTPKAVNDLKVDGHFNYTMAAKDGSVQFDFEGTYFDVKLHEKISYTIADGRKVFILFVSIDNQIHVVETFEAETMNPLEMQKEGWQNILDNFKKYTATNG